MDNGRTRLPVAIVVGGSGGMGQACARRLAQHHLVVLASRDIAKSKAVAEDLAREGRQAVPVSCDVTDAESVAGMVSESARLGPVRVLAHVAGLSPSMADSRRIMSVNLVGTANVMEAVLPAIAENGVTVIVSSMAAHMFEPDAKAVALLDDPLAPGLADNLASALGRELTEIEAYQYSKLGEVRMARRLVTRFAERRARIVSLSPGLIQTPMGALEFEKIPQKRVLFQLTPMAREGVLTEICDALEFLISDRASFITGTDLLIDGGLVPALQFGLQPPRFTD